MAVFHIAHSSDWDAALATGSYEISGRGMTLAGEGFIHCSTEAQLAATARRFYADDTEPLSVLVIDEHRVAASGVDLRFEDAGSGELFPHIYGAIRPEWVVAVRPARFVEENVIY